MCGRRRRAVRFGQVHRLPAARRGARAPLPGHRRDVPGDDLGGAARRASTSPTRPRSGRMCRKVDLRDAAPTRTRQASPSTGSDVDAQIRGPEVTAAVSAVAAVPAVRELLVARQREIIADCRPDRGRGPRHRRGGRPGRRPEGLPDRLGSGPGRADAAPRTPPTSRRPPPIWRGGTGSTPPARSTRCARPTTRCARHHRAGHRRGRRPTSRSAAEAMLGMSTEMDSSCANQDVDRPRNRTGPRPVVAPSSAGPTSASPPWSTGSSAAGRRSWRTFPG